MQVFLSYASQDESFAQDLAGELSKRGLSVWAASDQLLPGDNAWRKVADALRKSEAMVVLLSPASAQSDWVRREIEYALGDVKYEGRLFPVLVRRTAQIPWILRKFPILDAREGVAKTGQRIASTLRRVA